METVVENVTSRSAPSFSSSAAAFLMASRSPPLFLTKRRIESRGASQAPVAAHRDRHDTLRLAKGRRPLSAFAEPAQVSTPQPGRPQARERMCAGSFDHLASSQRYAFAGPASRPGGARRPLNAASTAASSASRIVGVQYGTRCRCPVCRTKRAAAAADRRLLAAVFSALCVTETKRSAQRWCEPTFLGSPLNAALLFRRPS